MRWLSYSQMSAYSRCPRRWRDGGREEPTEAMEIGRAAHEAIAAHLTGDTLAGVETEAGRAGVALAREFCEGFEFPSMDLVLSVEGAGIPARCAQKLYGRTMVGIPLSAEVGLRGVMDLVHTDPAGESLICVDWKSGHPDEESHALQGACYAVLSAAAWPGFSRMVFRPVYLRAPHADYRLSYTAAEVGAARELLTQRIQAMLGDQDCEPKANRYCSTCPLRATCPAYTAAVTTAPALPAVASLTPRQLEEADARARALAKILADYRAELDAELLRRVQAGPVIDGDQEWYLGTDLGNRKWDANEIASAAVSALNAGEITQDQFAALFSVKASGVDALKKSARDLWSGLNALASRDEKPAVKKRPAAMLPVQPSDPAALPFGEADVPPGEDNDGGPLTRRGEIRDNDSTATPAAHSLPDLPQQAGAEPSPSLGVEAAGDVPAPQQPPAGEGAASCIFPVVAQLAEHSCDNGPSRCMQAELETLTAKVAGSSPVHGGQYLGAVAQSEPSATEAVLQPVTKRAGEDAERDPGSSPGCPSNYSGASGSTPDEGPLGAERGTVTPSGQVTEGGEPMPAPATCARAAGESAISNSDEPTGGAEPVSAAAAAGGGGPARFPARGRKCAAVALCEFRGRHKHVFGVAIPGGYEAPDGATGPWLHVGTEKSL